MRNAMALGCLFLFGCGGSVSPLPPATKAVTPSEYKAILLAFVEDIRSTARATAQTEDRDLIRGEKVRLGKALDSLPIPPEGMKDGDIISQLKHKITVDGHEAIDKYFDAITKKKLGESYTECVQSGDAIVGRLDDSVESLKKVLTQID